MFKIQTIQGQLIAMVETPDYVKRSKNSGSWITAESSSDAEAVVALGNVYNIAGYPVADPELQTVEILEGIKGITPSIDFQHITSGSIF